MKTPKPLTGKQLEALISSGLGTVKDFRNAGYHTRSSILCAANVFTLNDYGRALLRNPDIIVENIGLYTPERAAAILEVINPQCYFNRMAVKFITGQFKANGEHLHHA